jgi:hypothetical protein
VYAHIRCTHLRRQNQSQAQGATGEQLSAGPGPPSRTVSTPARPPPIPQQMRARRRAADRTEREGRTRQALQSPRAAPTLRVTPLPSSMRIGAVRGVAAGPHPTHHTAQSYPRVLPARSSSVTDVAVYRVPQAVEPELPPPPASAHSRTPTPQSVTQEYSDIAEDEDLIPEEQLATPQSLLSLMSRLFPQSTLQHTSASLTTARAVAHSPAHRTHGGRHVAYSTLVPR